MSDKTSYNKGIVIEQFAKEVPSGLFSVSGAVFYSGRAAFGSYSSIYVLGLNPGGSAEIQSDETIEWHTNRVLRDLPEKWSAYKDESWSGKEPGAGGLQPRVLHLLESLGLDPSLVPASNVIFVRSPRQVDIQSRFDELAELCWPFHKSLIECLNIKVVLCFGRKAGSWVGGKLEADRKILEFTEQNRRRWQSRAFANNKRDVVVSLTHPSIADWTAPPTDPSPMVRKAIEYAVNNA